MVKVRLTMIVDETAIDVAGLLSEIDDLKAELKKAHSVIDQMSGQMGPMTLMPG